MSHIPAQWIYKGVGRCFDLVGSGNFEDFSGPKGSESKNGFDLSVVNAKMLMRALSTARLM